MVCRGPLSQGIGKQTKVVYGTEGAVNSEKVIQTTSYIS